MRKSKWIVLLLVVSMMAMGVGYAAWTQSFTVTSHADTGELKVIVDDSPEGTKVAYVDVFDENGVILDPDISGHTHYGFSLWSSYTGSDPAFLNGTQAKFINGKPLIRGGSTLDLFTGKIGHI